MNRKSPKRLIIDIDELLHTEIKKICAEKRMKIKGWVLEALIAKLKIEHDLGF